MTSSSWTLYSRGANATCHSSFLSEYGCIEYRARDGRVVSIDCPNVNCAVMQATCEPTEDVVFTGQFQNQALPLSMYSHNSNDFLGYTVYNTQGATATLTNCPNVSLTPNLFSATQSLVGPSQQLVPGSGLNIPNTWIQSYGLPQMFVFENSPFGVNFDAQKAIFNSIYASGKGYQPQGNAIIGQAGGKGPEVRYSRIHANPPQYNRYQMYTSWAFLSCANQLIARFQNYPSTGPNANNVMCFYNNSNLTDFTAQQTCNSSNADWIFVPVNPNLEGNVMHRDEKFYIYKFPYSYDGNNCLLWNGAAAGQTFDSPGNFNLVQETQATVFSIPSYPFTQPELSPYYFLPLSTTNPFAVVGVLPALPGAQATAPAGEQIYPPGETEDNYFGSVPGQTVGGTAQAALTAASIANNSADALAALQAQVAAQNQAQSQANAVQIANEQAKTLAAQTTAAQSQQSERKLMVGVIVTVSVLAVGFGTYFIVQRLRRKPNPTAVLTAAPTTVGPSFVTPYYGAGPRPSLLRTAGTV